VCTCLLLAEANAGINTVSQRGCASPLLVAAQWGHAEVVGVLLAARADPESVDSVGATPIAVAAQEGYDEVVRLLVGIRADISKADHSGLVPLWAAALMGHRGVLNALLSGSSNVAVLQPLLEPISVDQGLESLCVARGGKFGQRLEREVAGASQMALPAMG